MKTRKRHSVSALLAGVLAILLAFSGFCGTAEGAESAPAEPADESAAISAGRTLYSDAESILAAAEDDMDPADEGLDHESDAADGVENEGADDPVGAGQAPMYRLYNPNSGEHFYTASMTERDGLITLGWNYESIGWVAPSASDTPVYRLYNPNAGDHHYTMSTEERDWLVSLGWNDEGIGWYSDDAETVPIYRQYNPNAKAGAHNFTYSKEENDILVSLGWHAENIGWYAVRAGYEDTTYTLHALDGVDYGAIYDFDYYYAHNPDVAAAYGKDQKAVLRHFVTYGIFEGRQAKEGVSPSGAAYQEMRRQLQMKKKIVCIDPGHQLHSMTSKEPIGPGSSIMKQKVSSGTYGQWSRKNEYEVNLEVALKLQSVLTARGYTVVMTRTTNNVTLSNVDRAKIANNAGADIMVRIHCNGVDTSSVTGVLCYGPTLSNPYRSRSINQKSRTLCTLLRDYQCRATGQRARDNLYQDDMTGINWCDMPVAIVEMGFMSNRTEDLNLASNAFQDKIAQGLANGIDAYFSQN